MGPIFRYARAVTLCVATLLILAGMLCAQDEPATPNFSVPRIGLPEDWSTQRVIYTRNGSIDDMMAVRGDPRFLNSFLLHNMRETRGQSRQLTQTGLNNSDSVAERSVVSSIPGLHPQDPGDGPLPGPAAPPRNRNSRIDWAVPLGTSFGMAIGESPAKYTFDPSAPPSCSDFVVFSLKAPPKTGTQGNLVALTNLYSGASPAGVCGAAPTFLFSYAIGTGGSLLSPVLSLLGKKVAWIENTTANHAVLHVTTWLTGEGTNATTGSVAVGNCSSGASCDVAVDYTTSAYPGCNASTNINTNAEIYVDYASDTAFVGADNGILYHVKTIFTGTPTFDFCIPVNTTAGTAISGGVYDSLLSPPQFFIADSKKLYAYFVGASSFTLNTSVTYGAGTLTGPGPLLDAFNNFIYVFSAKDLANHTSVTQFPTTLATSVVVPLGAASTNAYPILFYGAFDNTYYNSGPKNAASTLYTCGTDATVTTAQDLYAVSFNAITGLANTTPAMSANKNVDPTSLNGTCSPITEFFDGTKDRIFVGMGQHSAASGANLITMWDVTTRIANNTTAATATASPYVGGSSAMVIDNNASGTAQAESVYFTTLFANGTTNTCGAGNYCAVKLTQGALK